MFDWEDEELTNMIWGEDGETDDHIVPFKLRTQQHNKKEQSEESKAEQKLTATKTNLHDSNPGSSLSHGIPQPWPDSSETEFSKCLAEPSTRGEKTSELGKGPDIFHSTDVSKKQGSFDEYDWTNIDSFDDLDRMFSDVPIFGDGSLNGTDKLWSSSNDVSNIPSKSLPSILDSQNTGLDIRTEFEQQEYRQFPLTGKTNGSPSQCGPSVASKTELYRQHKGQPLVENQPYQQNKMMKFSKMSSTSETRAFQNLYHHRTPPSAKSPGKFVNQFAPSQSSSMAVNPKNESQGSRTSQYPNMPNQYMPASGFGNLSNPYPVLSAVRCPDATNQLMHPSYNPAIPLNTAMDASARPLPMTPQEKLEKLRRRQQMQAMLAIQRQHQQFRHPDQSLTQNYRHEQTNLQGITTIPSLDPNSSSELNDSRNFSVADDDNSIEFSVLYQLQNVVAKMDMGVRTCIRDSLFRLADSAGQRHHNSDTAHRTSHDEHEVITKEESRHRYDGIPYTETVTNPADRTVAHLLFQRPLHMEGPDSPASSKIGTEVNSNFRRVNKHKAKVEERPANSGTASNSGSSSTQASHGNKRNL